MLRQTHYDTHQEIGFSLRNNGNTPVTVRFFGNNVITPFENGSILAENGLLGDTSTATVPFGTIIFNHNIFVNNEASSQVWDIRDIAAGSTVSGTGSLFPQGEPFTLKPSEQIVNVKPSPTGTTLEYFDASSVPAIAISEVFYSGLFFNTAGSFEQGVTDTFWLIEQSGNITLIDTVTYQIRGSISLAGTSYTQLIQGQFMGKTVVYAVGTDFIDIVDIANESLIKSINLAGNTFQAGVFNNNDSFLYVYNSTADQVQRINIEQGSIVGAVQPTGFPANAFQDIFFIDPDRNILWWGTSIGFQNVALDSFNQVNIIGGTAIERIFVNTSSNALVGTSTNVLTINLVNFSNDNQSTFNNLFSSAFAIDPVNGNLYAFDQFSQLLQVLITPQLEVLATTSGSVEQAFLEVQRNPILCNAIQVDAGLNRQQANKPLIYFTSTATGKRIDKRQPLIWSISPLDQLTILELGEEQLSEGGLLLSDKDGVELEIVPMADLYINFGYGRSILFRSSSCLSF